VCLLLLLVLKLLQAVPPGRTQVWTPPLKMAVLLLLLFEYLLQLLQLLRC
jgi:hypothetical protein